MDDPSTPTDLGVTLTHDGPLLTVTLNRPKRGNALSGEDATFLADTFDRVSNGTEARAVLVRAEGRHFCTGADISGGGSAGRKDSPTNGHMVRSLATGHHRAIASVFSCRLPVVAAVQGAAVGFGLHLALACDLVVAADAATFTEPFTDRGFSVDSGGSWLLPRLIGLSRAKRMIYLAQPVDATAAEAWGLIAERTPDAELDGRATSLARELAARPTQAVAASKRLLHDGTGSDLHQALHAESMAVELTLRSRDFKEGMKAFVQKRPAEFTGE